MSFHSIQNDIGLEAHSLNSKELILAKDSFAEIFKILLYKENPAFFDTLDINNDDSFLEPLLIAYFNVKKKKEIHPKLLHDILQKTKSKRSERPLMYSENAEGIAYIPNRGYYKNGNEKPFDSILKIDVFEILKYCHPVLEPYFMETYKGRILDSNPRHTTKWQDGMGDLTIAIEIIKDHLPEFYKKLCFANRKIYLHDNPKILNFTTKETLGMLYFYVMDCDNTLYFIEELIHQGSHNFFYYLLLNKNEFFKIDVEFEAFMRDFTPQKKDHRSIYGAFHGLYTVYNRLECFDRLLSEAVFKNEQKHELLGRLTDQFRRFHTGLQLLDLDTVFTQKGVELYQELDSKCELLLKKYQNLKNIFDLSHRDLDFRYSEFCVLNPISDFYLNEQKGFFNF